MNSFHAMVLAAATIVAIIVVGAFIAPSEFGQLGQYFEVLSVRNACADGDAQSCDDLYDITGCEFFTAEECRDMMD